MDILTEKPSWRDKKAYNHWRYQMNPEIHKEYYRRRIKSDPVRYSRRRNAGKHMPKEEFEKAMRALEIPGGCEICGKEGERVIDHNHQTKNFRGLLCRSCNLVIGFGRDSIEILEKAINYLRNHA